MSFFLTLVARIFTLVAISSCNLAQSFEQEGDTLISWYDYGADSHVPDCVLNMEAQRVFGGTAEPYSLLFLHQLECCNCTPLPPPEEVEQPDTALSRNYQL